MNGSGSICEELLMRRMVWRNLHNLDSVGKPDSRRDVEDNIKAVKMLTCIGCLDYIMMYLEDELVDLGKYKHNIKRLHKLYSEDVNKAHGMAYGLLRNLNSKASDMYNVYVDYYFRAVWDSVVLDNGVEKVMNILYSLSRLVEKYDRAISGRYNFAPSKRLYGAKERFKGLGVKDYELDFLVDKIISSKIKLEEVE